MRPYHGVKACNQLKILDDFLAPPLRPASCFEASQEQSQLATNWRKTLVTINSYSLRSRDVAHLLDISPDEVSELALRKELKAEKVGRLWRYKLEDVMAYRRKRERENG